MSDWIDELDRTMPGQHPCLSPGEARAVRHFIETYVPEPFESEAFGWLMSACPHPAFEPGGSMGPICVTCGALEEEITDESEGFN